MSDEAYPVTNNQIPTLPKTLVVGTWNDSCNAKVGLETGIQGHWELLSNLH